MQSSVWKDADSWHKSGCSEMQAVVHPVAQRKKFVLFPQTRA